MCFFNFLFLGGGVSFIPAALPPALVSSVLCPVWEVVEQKERIRGWGVAVCVELVWLLWHHRVIDEIEDGASKWLHCWRLMAINRTGVIM